MLKQVFFLMFVSTGTGPAPFNVFENTGLWYPKMEQCEMVQKDLIAKLNMQSNLLAESRRKLVCAIGYKEFSSDNKDAAEWLNG